MRFQCPDCHGIVAIDDAEFGEPVGCGHCGEVVTVPKTRFSPGVMINDFIIRDTLGHGGMGTVYLAHQFSLDRPVALKILMEQFSTNSEFIVDFVKEARAAASLNHPNIVQSYAVGEEDGIYFFAMEYVEGKTLKQMMDTEGAIPVDRSLNIIQQVAEALDFAWKQKQLVHRDIKPDNIMLTHRGVAKLADLGLARMAHETLDDDDDLVMGTPQYICPEQLLGQPMDVRGDIYSLGATMFHAVTGDFPFDGRNAAEIARKHLQEPMPDPQSVNPDLPNTVCWILRKMMAKKIEDRYEDAHELAIDLGYILKGEKPVGYTDEKPVPKASSSSGMSQKRPKSKTKGKVRLGTGTRMAAAGDVGEATESGLVTSDRSSGTRIEAAGNDGTKSTGGTKRPSKIIVTSRNTGATTTALVASPDKKKSGSTTGGFTAPGATGTRGAARSGPPKQSNLAMNLGLAAIAFLLVALIGGGALLFVKRSGWSPKSPKDAAELYLAQPHVTQGERDAYDACIRFFDQSENLSNNHDELVAAESALNKFVNEYPDSLFTIEPSPSTDYNEIYQTPWYANGQVDRMAAEAAGRIAHNLVQYQEKLIRYQREEALEAHKKKIDDYIKGGEEAARLQAALADVDAQVQGRLDKIRESYRRLEGIIGKKRALLAEEQREVRLAILLDGANMAFGRAKDTLDSFRGNLLRYPAPLSDEIPNYKRTEREANETVIVVKDISARHAGVAPNDLSKQHKDKTAELEITLELSKFDDLIAKDREFLADRDRWYDNTQQALSLANEYHLLFVNGADKLKNQRIPAPRGQRIRVGKVKDGKIEFQNFDFNPETGDVIITRTADREIKDLPHAVLSPLAAIVWGGEDVAGLQIREAAYFLYSANHGALQEAANAAQESMSDLSGFLSGELAELEPLMIEVICLQKKNDIALLVRQAELEPARRQVKLKEAMHIYEQLNKQYGDTPGFQKVKQQLLDLIPTTTGMPAVGGGNVPAGAED